MRLGSQTVTRIRADTSASEDEYGNEIPGADAETDFDGCSVQPGAGSEVLDRREATTTLYTVWCPHVDEIVETDLVRYAGTVYAVDGQVERWRVGVMDHDVIRLKAVAG